MFEQGYRMAKKKRQLHILIIPSWYKSPETPVLGTFFEEQARALQKHGFKVGIIYPEYRPPGVLFSDENNEFIDFYVDNDIPTFNIRTTGGIPKFRKLSYIQFSRSVNKVFENYIDTFGRPDIIHAHSVFHAGIAGYYISKKHQIPMVITEHLTAFLMGYITNKTDINLSKEIFENSSASLIVSNNFRKDIENHLGIKPGTFKVIHNLVNDLFFNKFVPKEYIPGTEFRFFTNSFLLPRKNIPLIIEALKILLGQNHHVHLTIGGDGPEEENLKALVNQLGISNHVKFTGKLWREEVKQEIDNCHSFVLASQYETFGVVLIESLACGRPVVCTNSGGPLDFIHKEQGVIVNDHNAEALAAGMMQLMSGYNSYDQQAMIDYCFQNFNEKKIAGEIIGLYYDVLEKQKTTAY